MRKSIKVHQKKRGRPATGRDPAVTVRLPKNLLRNVDAWAKWKEFDRSEAIRVLLQSAFQEQMQFVLAGDNAERAANLAANAVKKIADKSQPAEEQQRRKRALIKGPKEFREIREDLPKSKSLEISKRASRTLPDGD
jgi:Arc/MetJ-type ribon-helix-helix transcriptional regulator